MSQGEVICTSCPKHCVIAFTALKPCGAKQEAPKDSLFPIPSVQPKLNDIRQYCKDNYESV